MMCSARSSILVIVLPLLATCSNGTPPSGENIHSRRNAREFTYPQARRNMSVVDNYHGTEVHDPYRWLEDPKSAETKAFVDAQNALSQSFFDSSPVSEKIKEKLTKETNYEKFDCPRKEGGRYYYFYNTGLQNQDVMYVRDSLESEPSVFLDPNLLSEDGSVTLSYAKSFTKDGSLFAYTISTDGSDWMTIKVKQAPSGEDLPDTVEFVKLSYVAWTPDNKGFFYSRYPDSASQPGGEGRPDEGKNVNHSLYYHRLGTDQRDDIQAFIPPDPMNWVRACTSHDGHSIIVTIKSGTAKIKIYFEDIRSRCPFTGQLNPVPVIDNFDNRYEYVTSEGRNLVLLTDKDAPFKKIIRVNVDSPQPKNWTTLIKTDPMKGLIKDCIGVDNKLVLNYLQEAKSEIYIHDLKTGKFERQVNLDFSSVSCLEGHKTGTELFYGVKSFLYPGSVYRLDMRTYNKTVFGEARVRGLVPDDFETKQVFYNSYDGTRVPMFLVHKKNLTKTGRHPALMHGYGGFRIPLAPRCDIGVLLFIQHLGGVFAMPNIRGGSEYGEDWHKNATLGNKQKSFDDFQAAGEYLISNNYTSNSLLAIRGRSNGGLLIGACLNQRPDLFAAGIAVVGLMDMLRYHQFTIGHLWIPEFGSSDNATQFPWLYGYSPLHNIPSNPKGGQYPATLLLTASKDDRVVPLHSLKFIAELQHTMGDNPNQTNPLLIHVDTNSGHGTVKTTSKEIEEVVQMFSFLSNTMNLTWTEV